MTDSKMYGTGFSVIWQVFFFVVQQPKLDLGCLFLRLLDHIHLETHTHLVGLL